MKITWSFPVRGLSLDAHRGDVVRARSLIAALVAEGHEVAVVEQARGPGAAQSRTELYRNAIRPILPAGFALVARDLGRWIEGRRHGAHVAAVAERQGADVVIETQVGFAESGAVATRRTGLPLVLDDCSPSREERLLGAGLPALSRKVLRRQLEAATRVVAVSEVIASNLAAEGASVEKIRLVPNGVDESAYLAARRDDVRLALGFEGCTVVGFAGSFQPWHEVGLLMEALASMSERVSRKIRILLVGQGEGLRPALDRAERLGVRAQVVSVGEVSAERVPSFVSAFDIGVLPGTNDYGHPMKLLEYAAAGVPSIAPDVPPVREWIEPRISGLLFRPGSAAELTGALVELVLNDPLRRRLGTAARSSIARDASWRSRARALVSELELSGRRAVS